MVNIYTYIYISDVLLVFLVLPVVSLTYIYYTRHKKDMVCREGKVKKDTQKAFSAHKARVYLLLPLTAASLIKV